MNTCNKNNNKIALDGDFIEYDKKTKDYFYNTFVSNTVYRHHKKITVGSSEDEINKCYEHITTKGQADNVRFPDLRRYESIYILKDILSDYNCYKCKDYYVWEKYDKYLKEMIFCPNVGYLIILNKRKYVYKIVSAYHINSQNKINKLINEYKKYTKKEP